MSAAAGNRRIRTPPSSVTVRSRKAPIYHPDKVIVMITKKLAAAGLFLSLALPSCIIHANRACELHGQDEKTAAASAKPAGGAAGSGGAMAKAPEGDESQKAVKLAQAERGLSLARARLEKVRADAIVAEQSSKEGVMAAEADLTMAQRNLANFEEKTSKLRIEQARNNLTMAMDNYQENVEELQQLEMMYEKTDLADKTREIVIARTRRRLERAQRSLELQKKSLENLESVEIPMERAKLQMDLDSRTRALERARREMQSSLADKRLAIMAQEHDVARQEEELDALRKPAARSASAAK